MMETVRIRTSLSSRARRGICTSPSSRAPSRDLHVSAFPHSRIPAPPEGSMSKRSEVLAVRLEEGVRQLIQLAQTLNDEQWKTKIPHDGRTIGVVVHHVGTMYPIEIDLAQKLGAGQAVE